MPKKIISSEELAQYKRDVDIANKRLKRIEKYAERQGFENIKEFAYKSAKLDIRHIYGVDQSKFSKKTKDLSYAEFKQRQSAVERFLSAKSSTFKGIESTYRKRADTLNKKYKWGLNWQDLALMFESSAYKKLSSKYGYETAFRTIGRIMKNRQKISEDTGRVRIRTKDQVFNKIAQDFIKSNKTDIKEFLSSLE